MSLHFTNKNGLQPLNVVRENDLDFYLYLPGPSLASVNDSEIHVPGAVSFAVNTAYPKVRPDYWVGMDTPECYDNSLLYEPFTKIFRMAFKNYEHKGKKLYRYPFTYFAMVKDAENDVADLHMMNDEYQPFAWHRHTLGVALHVMLRMGAKRIFLVGCDLGGEKDYYHDKVLDDKLRSENRRLYKAQVSFLKKFHSIGINRGVEVVSCTPDSPINTFLEYIPLKEALDQSRARVASADQNYQHVIEVMKSKLQKQVESITWKAPPKIANGVIVGVDKGQEWMLEWWWKNYRDHNDYPVAFVDLGMTDKGRKWCKEHGELCNLPDIQIDTWFKKPFAMMQTPFKNSVWLDVDCEVMGNIGELFMYARVGLGMVEDLPNRFNKTSNPYNTGVVAYRHGNKSIRAWADAIIPNEAFYRSDQDLFEMLLVNGDAEVITIPNKYNWVRLRGKPDNNTVIYHHTGQPGKDAIKKQLINSTISEQ